MQCHSVDAGGCRVVSGQSCVALQGWADAVLVGGDEGSQQPYLVRAVVRPGVVGAAQAGGESRQRQTGEDYGAGQVQPCPTRATAVAPDPFLIRRSVAAPIVSFG